MRAIYILPITLIVALVLLLSSVFIVDQRDKALVLQFGQIKQVIEEPGLNFKIPFIQEVLTYDARILGVTTEPAEFTLGDSKRLVVDAFARWRITDLPTFRRAVGAGGIEAARANLSKIINPEIRDVLGAVTLDVVLSDQRMGLMTKIRDNARIKAASLGIDVIDVRLTRTDLPQQNLEATFARMQAERQREATDEVARGNEAAQTIRAEANRQAIETKSEANKNAEIVRGEADAKRIAILAAAYGRDPEFFAFMRSMTAYGTAMDGSTTSLVLSPDSDFFRYFNGPAAPPATGAPADVTAAAPGN